LRIILDVRQSTEGRLEGALRVQGSRVARTFEGIIELVGLLEASLKHPADGAGISGNGALKPGDAPDGTGPGRGLAFEYAREDPRRPAVCLHSWQTSMGGEVCQLWRAGTPPAPGYRREDALAAAWYCAITSAGMRPRSLSSMPCSVAHARISALR
jgi:hypothetical protein